MCSSRRSRHTGDTLAALWCPLAAPAIAEALPQHQHLRQLLPQRQRRLLYPLQQEARQLLLQQHMFAQVLFGSCLLLLALAAPRLSLAPVWRRHLRPSRLAQRPPVSQRVHCQLMRQPRTGLFTAAASAAAGLFTTAGSAATSSFLAGSIARTGRLSSQCRCLLCAAVMGFIL